MDKPLKDTKLGAWFRNNAPNVLDKVGDVVPGGQILSALGATIDALTVSDSEKEEARNMLLELELEDRKSARNREVEFTQATGKRDWIQAGIAALAMLIGIAMVFWAWAGVEDKEIFFHILGFAEGTLVGQVVNYYFGSSLVKHNQ